MSAEDLDHNSAAPEPNPKPEQAPSKASDKAPGSNASDPSLDSTLPLPEFQLPPDFANDATAQLVARAKTGDSEALNELFTRYHQIVVEVARRRIGPRLRLKEEPDDLAQTTFREATRDFRNYEYRGEGSLVRWLMQILQNKIRDKAEFYAAGKRDQSRERTMDAPTSKDAPESLGIIEPPSQDLSVTMHVSRGENNVHLLKALNELSVEHRRAITLVFFEGRQLREAGELMGGKSEDAVRMMLRRAEQRLAEILHPTLGKDLG